MSLGLDATRERLVDLAPSRQVLVRVFVVALLLSAAWIALLAYGASQHGPTSRGAFVADYDGRVLDDGLELLIIQSDGQAYATLARDPLLRDVGTSFRTDGEAAYRAQRPMLGWLAWASSLGRSGWVPPALATLCSLGAALAASGTGALLLHRNRSAWLGLGVLLLPGTPLTLSILSAETLMLGLLALGLVAWERGRPSAAAVLLLLASLSRESAVLVPLALGLASLGRRNWHGAIRLAIVPSGIAAWYLTLRLHLGAWPWEVSEGRLGPPLVGLLDAVRDLWTDHLTQAMLVALTALTTLAVFLVARRDVLTSVVGMHAVFALFMGRYVWSEPLGYGRVLLPLYAFGLVAVAGGLSIGRAGRSESLQRTHVAGPSGHRSR